MGEGIDPRFKAFAGENIFKIDLSEVRWTDDFHGPASSIKEAQELAADAWGAARSHFLVNGTSGGVIAAICSVVGDGDRIIVPRNAHKSAVYGLVISGAEPVYVSPLIDDERELIGSFAPEALERAFERHPGVKALFMVSPTYHGVMSDTEKLAAIAHRHGAVLIADEAHGNHMYFSDRLPRGALELGADIVCQRTHKMSGSLTQASILHLGRDAAQRVDFDRVRANLSMVQTTSPSYILLASLDMARSYIATRGEVLLGAALDALEKARDDIASLPGIEVLGYLEPSFVALEPTRLVISARGIGLDGYELFRILRENYRVECEFADPRWCVCVAGIGTTAAHTEALTDALTDIAKNRTGAVIAGAKELRNGKNGLLSGTRNGAVAAIVGTDGCRSGEDSILRCARDDSDTTMPGTDGFCSAAQTAQPPIPPLLMTPREAWFAEKEAIPFEDARGRVSAEMVVPYPPGIPVLCPGEAVTEEVHDFLTEQRNKGRHMHSMAGDSLATLSVVK